MTTFTAWLPAIICLATLLLYLIAMKTKIIKPKSKKSAWGFGFLVLAISVFVVLFLWWHFFIYAIPSKNWKEQTKKTETAILFGFGYNMCKGRMLPGKANQALYDQAVNSAGTPVLHLIMQEGVMVAALRDTNQYLFTRNLIRMHPHNDSIYISTFEAAEYALHKMDSLGVKSAVVYSHSMQLARSVYILKQVAASNPRWKDFEFITPCIYATPFPRKSVQLHTRCKFIYFFWELASRPYTTWTLWRDKSTKYESNNERQTIE